MKPKLRVVLQAAEDGMDGAGTGGRRRKIYDGCRMDARKRCGRVPKRATEAEEISGAAMEEF